jgi:hypothetical protein
MTKLSEPELSDITIELRRRKRSGEKITGRTVGEAAKAVKSAFFVRGTGDDNPLIDTGTMRNAVKKYVDLKGKK